MSMTPIGPGPSRRDLAVLRLAIGPMRWLAAPVFHGLAHVPARGPLLFVGNHTLGGVFDAPFLWMELAERGVVLRALGDHAHFQVPGWRSVLNRLGVVDGTRENCGRLMASGASVLVFPGGAREVTKRRGERYQLIWKDRLGFARMAVAHGCQIVPFAAVGVEHVLRVVADADDLLASPVGPVVRRLGLREDLIFPLVRGMGPGRLPMPQRLYFQIRPPIDPRQFTDDPGDDVGVRALRDLVRGDILQGIHDLRVLRREDPERHLRGRLVRRLRHRG